MVIRSIRFRLLLMILFSVLLLWAAVLNFTWWRTYTDIERVYDAELEQIANVFAAATAHEADEHDLEDYAADLNGVDFKFPLIFQIWSHDNQLMVRGPDTPEQPISPSHVNGFTDVTFESGGWRVYTVNLPEHDYRIQVARSHKDMRSMVNAFVLDVVKPLLLALPLFGMLWWVVHRGLAPLRQVSQLIAERDYSHLNPVTVERIPEESSSLVNEINALLTRLRASIERNSRFTADVAHELRTPIAGMLVQLQSADGSLDQSECQLVIDKVKHGLERLNHVVNQLLVLASIEPEKIRQTFEQVDLGLTAGEVMSELYPLAQEKGVELELDAEERLQVQGNLELITILFTNLIGNAIKFSPRRGVVSVKITSLKRGISVSVEDTGPGIPEEKKAWVFERLNRGTEGGGSGLGLSIVKEICQLHQATIMLEDKKSPQGLSVNLFFPQLSKA